MYDADKDRIFKPCFWTWSSFTIILRTIDQIEKYVNLYMLVNAVVCLEFACVLFFNQMAGQKQAWAFSKPCVLSRKLA